MDHRGGFHLLPCDTCMHVHSMRLCCHNARSADGISQKLELKESVERGVHMPGPTLPVHVQASTMPFHTSIYVYRGPSARPHAPCMCVYPLPFMSTRICTRSTGVHLQAPRPLYVWKHIMDPYPSRHVHTHLYTSAGVHLLGHMPLDTPP